MERSLRLRDRSECSPGYLLRALAVGGTAVSGENFNPAEGLGDRPPLVFKLSRLHMGAKRRELEQAWQVAPTRARPRNAEVAKAVGELACISLRWAGQS